MIVIMLKSSVVGLYDPKIASGNKVQEHKKSNEYKR